MLSRPTVAVVDDDLEAGARTVQELERGGYEASLVDGVPAGDVDCLVTELDLPETKGLAPVEQFRKRVPDAATVVYTGRGSEAAASRAITLGVDEYVPKSRGPGELIAALDRALERREIAPLDERKEVRADGSTSPVNLPAVDARSIGRVTGDGPDVGDLERYRTIVETAGDMIYTLDAEGTLTYVNPVFAEYFGYRRAEAIGTDVAEVLPAEAYDAGQRLVTSLLEEGSRDRGHYVFEIERPDGTVRTLENSVVIYHDDGYLRGSAGVIRDVTRRREAERGLRRQNERLEEFAHVVGHDLRNPLNVIQGRLELLRETGDLEHLEELEECAAHMDVLLSELLELARGGERIDAERVALEAVASEAWTHLETGEVTLELEGDLGTLEADRTRLGQLFENLFRNAVEHGSETVTVEGTPEGFAVADDGPGIDPDVGDRIFERGFTTRSHGTGLGLSIVSSIVDAHGWSIDLDDEYDGGARFEIRT